MAEDDKDEEGDEACVDVPDSDVVVLLLLSSGGSQAMVGSVVVVNVSVNSSLASGIADDWGNFLPPPPPLLPLLLFSPY